MQYISERPKIMPRIVVPAQLRSFGENLQEFWGKESVVLWLMMKCFVICSIQNRAMRG